MSTSPPLSVLIALFATMGAIPLCRSLLQKSMKRAPDGAAHRLPAGGAGAGMLLGVLMSLFYLEIILEGVMQLVCASALLAVVGSWVERQRRDADSVSTSGYEIGASVIAGLLVLFASFPGFTDVPLVPVSFAAFVLVAPVSVSMLGQSGRSHPSLAPGVVIVQLLLLVLLGLDAPGGAQGGYQEVSLVVLPVLGALAGVMIYLMRMPWRREAEISLGTGARLCLGLVVAWTAVRLGSGTNVEASKLMAATWVLSLPVFELLRRLALSRLQTQEARAVAVGSYGKPSSSSAMLLILTGLFGAVGISLRYLQVPDVWSLTALFGCLVLYVVVPTLLASWNEYRHAGSVANASRQS